MYPGDDPAMKANVTITLKKGVLDPQGKAIEHALGGLGFELLVGSRNKQHRAKHVSASY